MKIHKREEWYENGQLWTQRWLNDYGRFYRLDGPAYQSWYENGHIMQEMWCINGDLHRLDGPAFREWSPGGQLECEAWYINDVQYETEAEFQVAVDLYKANEIAELF